MQAQPLRQPPTTQPAHVVARPTAAVPPRPAKVPAPAATVATRRIGWLTLAFSAALLGGILGFIGDAYHIYWGFVLDAERSELLDTAAYRAHGVTIAIGYALALLALPGLTQAGSKGAKAPLAIGVVLAFMGTVLVAGDYWAESVVTPGVVGDQQALVDEDASGLHLAFVIGAFALHAIGWLLVAIGLGRAGAPKWLAAVMGVGALLAFLPLAGSNLVLFLAVALSALWLRQAGSSVAATGRP